LFRKELGSQEKEQNNGLVPLKTTAFEEAGTFEERRAGGKRVPGPMNFGPLLRVRQKRSKNLKDGGGGLG